ADLADVADQVRRESVLGIQPTLLVNGLQLRHLVGVRRNKFLLVRRNVLLQRNRLVLGCKAILPQQRVNLIYRHVQPARNQRKVRRDFVRLVAHQKAGNRRVVIHQQTSLAVKNLTTGCQNRDFADAIRLRQRVIILPAHNLQAPQPEQQYHDHRDDDVLKHSQLERRQVPFVPPDSGDVVVHLCVSFEVTQWRELILMLLPPISYSHDFSRSRNANITTATSVFSAALPS